MSVNLDLSRAKQEEPSKSNTNPNPFAEMVVFNGKEYRVLRVYEKHMTLYVLQLGTINIENCLYDDTHLLPIGLIYMRWSKKSKEYFLFETKAAAQKAVGFEFTAVRVKISKDKKSLETVGETVTHQNYSTLYKTMSKSSGSAGYFLGMEKLPKIIKDQIDASGMELLQDVQCALANHEETKSSKKCTSSNTNLPLNAAKKRTSSNANLPLNAAEKQEAAADAPEEYEEDFAFSVTTEDCRYYMQKYHQAEQDKEEKDQQIRQLQQVTEVMYEWFRQFKKQPRESKPNGQSFDEPRVSLSANSSSYTPMYEAYSTNPSPVKCFCQQLWSALCSTNSHGLDHSHSKPTSMHQDEDGQGQDLCDADIDDDSIFSLPFFESAPN